MWVLLIQKQALDMDEVFKNGFKPDIGGGWVKYFWNYLEFSEFLLKFVQKLV